MVNGIGSAPGNNFLQRPISSGSGVFSVSDDNPRNLLQVNPLFQPPAQELREAEEQRVRNNPLLNTESGLNNEEAATDSRAVAAEPRLGESISQLAIQSQLDNPGGGSPIEVESGELTFTAGEQQITVGVDDEARILRNDDGSMTIRNETTDEEQTFEAGQQIVLEGEGEATISGTTSESIGSGENQTSREVGNQLTFSAGDRLNITSEGGGALSEIGSEESIIINPSEPTSIAIAGNAGERFVFGNDRGVSLEFEAGQTGTLAQTQQGDVVITNEDTGQSAVFTADQRLSTGGDATARLRTPGGDRLDFEGRDRGSFQPTEDGTLELANLATRESIQVQPPDEPAQPERPLQLQTFEDPFLTQSQRLQEELIRRPDEEARSSARETEEEENNSFTSEQAEEEQSAQPASFENQQEDISPEESVSPENLTVSPEDDQNLLINFSEAEEELPGNLSDPEPEENEFPFNQIQPEEEADALARSFSENEEDAVALIGQQINFRA